MRARAAVLGLWLLAPPLRAQGLADAEAAYRTGRYSDAIAGFVGLAQGRAPDPAALRGLVRSYAAVGRYDDAEAAARRSPALANALGEVLSARGRLTEAEAAFQTARTRPGPDSVLAELNLAVLHYRRGARGPAMQAFNTFIQYYNAAPRLTSTELTAVGIACTYLGADSPQLYKDALKAFDEAIAQDPQNLEPLVLEGQLFLEKYNSTDAAESFQRVLQVNPNHPQAQLGMARTRHFDNDPQAAPMTRMALENNPNLVEARTFLARLDLELEEYGEAAREAEAALRVNPASLDALSLLAAARLFQGDQAGYEGVRGRALALNPRYADLYTTLAELATQNRLYASSLDLARQAIALDPRSWRGHAILGTGLLRTGRIQEGRAALETAFAGDPYNVWTKNTLDLLDRLEQFREIRTSRFVFVMHPRESDLLVPYLTELGEDAYQKLAARYDYRPATVRLEVYPSHADFSVRTMGLTGLGALGVSFGPVLAMDSPSARDLGHFNWASTFWHELTHTFTLGATDNRVPRWFSEGLSVLEERRAGRGWGGDVSPEFLSAHRQHKLLALAQLNNGFVRPTHPGQVLLSYYQASLVCELIERDWGMPKILALLRAFRNGHGTEDAFREVLGLELEQFDQRFDTYVRTRFAAALASMRDRSRAPRDATVEDLVRAARADTGAFAAQLAAGHALREAGRLEEAVPYLERGSRLFPEYAGPDSPYWELARIHQAQGRLRQAAEQLTRQTAIAESDYRANLQLADLLERLGDRAGAAAALERAIYIYPLDPAVHVQLAELAARLERRPMAVRERRAVLALDPVDRAEARYQLARAYFEAGDGASARREVLRALEEAPSFEQAQRLLLEIRGAR